MYTFFYFNNSNKGFLHTLESLPKYLILNLSFLSLGAIFIGYFTKDFFIGPNFANLEDIEFLPYYIKLIPILIVSLGTIFSLIYIPFYKFNYLLTIFNRRFFFDSIYNYILSYPVLLFSYTFTFKTIDRGFLEFFGPVGFFRFFFYFPNHYSLTNQSISNLNYLFIYLFLSFLSLLVFIISFFSIT